jgi:hypothetical protein
VVTCLLCSTEDFTTWDWTDLSQTSPGLPVTSGGRHRSRASVGLGFPICSIGSRTRPCPSSSLQPTWTSAWPPSRLAPRRSGCFHQRLTIRARELSGAPFLCGGSRASPASLRPSPPPSSPCLAPCRPLHPDYLETPESRAIVTVAGGLIGRVNEPGPTPRASSRRGDGTAGGGRRTPGAPDQAPPPSPRRCLKPTVQP